MRLVPWLLVLSALLVSGCRCGEQGKAGRTGDNPPVVVVDPDEVNRPKPLDESEPNNDRETAQPLTEQHDVQGRLSDAKDRDWYRVDVTEEGRVLQASVSGVPGGDLVLEAFDREGKRLVKVNNSKEGGGEVLVNLATGPGRYFLRVRAVKGRVGEGTYRVGYTLREREEGEELEPNWKAELATPLPLDAEASGYLGWHTDTDWYRVTLSDVPAGARLRVEFDGVDGVRAGVSLRGADGAVLQERWGREGEPVILSNLAVPTPPGGELYVVARCRYEANVESRYTLRVLSVVPSGPTEVEPNDQPEQATLLPADGRTVVSGQLADTADRDYFAIRVARPTAVRVEALPPLGLDLALALVDAKGKPLWNVDQGGPREPEVLPVLWVQPPGAVVQVRAPHGRHVSAVTPYQIKAQPLEGDLWEHEPNDDPGAATPWGGEQRSMSGFLHPEADVDYYRLGRVEAGLTLSGKPAAGLELKLDLLLPEGGTVAKAVSRGPGAGLRLHTDRSGEFVLRVSSARRDAKLPGEGGYTLTREGTTEGP